MSIRAQAFVLSLSVAWQAYVQDAPHLYVTAAIAFLFKAVVIPIALHRIIARLGIDARRRECRRHRPDHARRASRWSRFRSW